MSEAAGVLLGGQCSASAPTCSSQLNAELIAVGIFFFLPPTCLVRAVECECGDAFLCVFKERARERERQREKEKKKKNSIRFSASQLGTVLAILCISMRKAFTHLDIFCLRAALVCSSLFAASLYPRRTRSCPWRSVRRICRW